MKDFLNLKTINEIQFDKDILDIETGLDKTLLFIGNGLFCGIIASLFLFGYSRFLQLRQQHAISLFTNRYYYMAVIVVILSVLSYFHDSFNYGYKTIISDLINIKSIKNAKLIKWGANIKSELIYCIIVRLIIFCFFSTAAIPFGTFIPGLIIGAMIGRLYGNIMRDLFGININPTVFAFGATGAWIGCVNKSFSISIIVLEMARRFEWLFPVLVTTLSSFLVTGIFNISFFDMIINLRNLLYLPKMFSREKLKDPIKSIQLPITSFLFQNCSVYDIFLLAQQKKILSVNDIIPVLTPQKKLVGILQYQ